MQKAVVERMMESKVKDADISENEVLCAYLTAHMMNAFEVPMACRKQQVYCQPMDMREHSDNFPKSPEFYFGSCAQMWLPIGGIDYSYSDWIASAMMIHHQTQKLVEVNHFCVAFYIILLSFVQFCSIEFHILIIEICIRFLRIRRMSRMFGRRRQLRSTATKCT